ncbi:hypothetical protein JCM10450v2_006203 [Rhodotorula kratochvilovae]
MTSPPHKMTKLLHSDTAAPTSRNHSPARGIPTAAPPPSTSRRLGLASGVDKSKVRKLALASKPRAAPASDPTSLASTALATLTRAVRAIHARPPQPVPESLQALYTLCEAAVASGPHTSQALYDRIRLEVERECAQVRRALAEGDVLDGDEERWIARFEDEGRRFADQMLLIRSIFLQLDRTYVLQSPGLLSIWDLGLDLFEHSVLADPTVSSRITSCILQLVARERAGTSIPLPLLRAFLLRLSSFSRTAHTTLFVTPFLSATSAHYTALGTALAAQLGAGAYLARVGDALREEKERVQALGAEELVRAVEGAVEEGMIRTQVVEIAEKDTAAMCAQDRREDLAALYALLRRVDEVRVLRAAFLAYLKSALLALVSDPSRDATMVDSLIAFRHRARALVAACFASDADFSSAINAGFEFAVNKRENKPAEMMAKYLDAKLRSGGARGLDDAALEGVLNDVLYLFRFTQGKDIFEAFYKRDLAKRLLLNKSASFDAERSMLLKLKDECGPGFTQKLEIMFKDMDLSADVMRAYSASSSSSGADPFDLSVSVLSQGNWPTYPPFPLALPPALASALERFRAFYVSKHSGRALAWAHGLGTVSLRAQFPAAAGGKGGGRKELLVSLAQACVLLLFNETGGAGEEGGEGRLSTEEIGKATQLEPKELARTLQSLACGKVRVLVKHPKGREVNPGDVFSFNTEFKDDHVRIKINQIQQKETVEENRSTTERVFTDRASHLQLAIVRIMKARKTLKHQELVMEVVSQIGQRFKVEPAEIKKSISSLIDREYMRRADDATNVYHYVA